MIKNIVNNWDWQEPSINKINFPTKLIKSAGWYKVYKSNPDNTYVNAIFMGSGEYWGCNNNGDWFSEDDLRRRHNTFVTHAKHYKHHKNDDPMNSYGEVVETFYNPDMNRVEGIIKIINKKSPDMISRINRGEQVPLSMACKVLNDICSICQHASKTLEEYCDHLKYEMCDIHNDGKKVYAINPNPTFFDISEVVKGADNTAYTLRKIASDKKNNNITNIRPIKKQSVLDSLAAIEKRIEGMINDNNPSVKILRKGVCRKDIPLDKYSNEQLIGGMSKSGISLRVPSRTIYRDIQKVANQIEYLDIPFNNLLDKYIDSNSNLMKYAEQRILNNNDNLIDKIDTRDYIKRAMLNIQSIYNNKELANDKFFMELTVLQNFI